MAAQAYTYSFLDVQCALSGPGGNISMGGDGSGAAKEGITIDPSEDIGTLTIGAGGEGMHSLHAGRPAKATIRLSEDQPDQSAIEPIVQYGRFLISALYGKNTIVVSDTARGDLVTCLFAGFAKFPNVIWAEDANYNEWMFNVARVSWNLGDGGAN